VCRIKADARLHGMDKQRGACERVQNLWQVRLHPCAFACGEDDQGSFHMKSLCILFPVCLSAN
jgi:hypothetical protein